MVRVVTYNEIDRAEWSRLVQTSATGTWFQTPEAFEFFESMPELFRPFVIGIAVERVNDLTNERTLRGVCVGYVTVERNPIKQYFTRRAIIIGGPALADDAMDEEVVALLEAVKTKTRHLQSLNSDLHETTHQNASQKHAALTKNTQNIFYCYEPIYIETRNFNDYSQWKGAFEKAGFEYKKHLNFHVDCTDKEQMWERLSENRKRQVRHVKGDFKFKISFPFGTITSNLRFDNLSVTEQDVREWYSILSELYRTKVKTPLWPVEFFLEFYRQKRGVYLLQKHNGKVIGGIMCPIFENRCIYEWYICGMDAEYKESHPSVMATWAAMEYANTHAIARFDVMGAGEPGVPYGVRDFKAEFGGQLVEHGRFVCVRKHILYKIGTLAVKMMKS